MKKTFLILFLIFASFLVTTSNVKAYDYKIQYETHGGGGAGFDEDDPAPDTTNDNQNGSQTHTTEGTNANNVTPSAGTSDGVGCEEIGGEFTKWLSDAFKIVQYVGVGLAIILTAVDFVQVIAGSKDDELKKAFDRSIKRLVAVVLLLLTTVLVTFITSTFIDPVVDTDIPNCVENV